MKRCEAKVEQERMQEDFERRMMEKRTGKGRDKKPESMQEIESAGQYAKVFFDYLDDVIEGEK